MDQLIGAPRILVLGGAHMDHRGTIHGPTVPAASNPGHFAHEPGGGGFNAARNLAALGHAVRMISPRGGDADGETVAAAALAAGVEDHPFVYIDRRTPGYTAILSETGDLVIALADMDLYRLFTPRRLLARTVRADLDWASHILCDANLPEETIEALAHRARDMAKPLAGIAISPAKVVRFRRAVSGLDFLFMNGAEAAAFSGREATNSADWPAILRDCGLKGGAITQGGRDIIAFDETHSLALTPPPVGTVVDVTGAGDAFAAATLSALAGGTLLPQAIRQGAALASLTVSSSHAVVAETMKDVLVTLVGLVDQPRNLA